MAFGGARGLAAKAPEKGVFPLDHFGECKTVMKDYLACLKKEKGDSLECKKLSKLYLECRMDKYVTSLSLSLSLSLKIPCSPTNESVLDDVFQKPHGQRGFEQARL